MNKTEKNYVQISKAGKHYIRVSSGNTCNYGVLDIETGKIYENLFSLDNECNEKRITVKAFKKLYDACNFSSIDNELRNLIITNQIENGFWCLANKEGRNGVE